MRTHTHCLGVLTTYYLVPRHNCHPCRQLLCLSFVFKERAWCLGQPSTFPCAVHVNIWFAAATSIVAHAHCIWCLAMLIPHAAHLGSEIKAGLQANDNGDDKAVADSEHDAHDDDGDGSHVDDDPLMSKPCTFAKCNLCLVVKRCVRTTLKGWLYSSQLHGCEFLPAVEILNCTKFAVLSHAAHLLH